MALDYLQTKEVKRMLNNRNYWNIAIAPDGTDNSYPRYSQIADTVGCPTDDVKEYKDLFLGNWTPKTSR